MATIDFRVLATSCRGQLDERVTRLVEISAYLYSTLELAVDTLSKCARKDPTRASPRQGGTYTGELPPPMIPPQRELPRLVPPREGVGDREPGDLPVSTLARAGSLSSCGVCSEEGDRRRGRHESIQECGNDCSPRRARRTQEEEECQASRPPGVGLEELVRGYLLRDACDVPSKPLSSTSI